jgi:hypothetical protein
MRGSLAETQKGIFAISFVFNIAVSGRLLLSGPTVCVVGRRPCAGFCAHDGARLVAAKDGRPNGCRFSHLQGWESCKHQPSEKCSDLVGRILQCDEWAIGDSGL